MCHCLWPQLMKTPLKMVLRCQVIPVMKFLITDTFRVRKVTNLFHIINPMTFQDVGIYFMKFVSLDVLNPWILWSLDVLKLGYLINNEKYWYKLSPPRVHKAKFQNTVEPWTALPQAARTLDMHIFLIGCTFYTSSHIFDIILINEYLKCTLFAHFCTFFARFLKHEYLRYTIHLPMHRFLEILHSIK